MFVMMEELESVSQLTHVCDDRGTRKCQPADSYFVNYLTQVCDITVIEDL